MDNLEDDIVIEDLEAEQQNDICQLLPDEILLKIFSYMKTFDVLHSVALVCKKFYGLSKDPSVIEQIILKPNYDHLNAQTIIDAISRSRGLKSLTLKGNNLVML